MAKYFIATYSAHGTVVKNLIGSGNLEYLCVNCGGFKCPQNCIDVFEDDVSMFKKSVAISKKTLHAKVTLVENGKNNELWLWTGNMRRSTLQDRNVLLNIRLEKGVKKIEKWFENLAENKGATSNHLIYDEKKGVSSPKQSMWDTMSKSIDQALLQKEAKDNLTVYACSPWGSKRFVDELCGHVRLKNAKFKIFTRYIPPQDPCWMDGSKENVDCYVSNGKEFPHYKMLFITRKGKIIWAYIGSANFTESAMFADKKNVTKNIEHAAFFYSDSNDISSLLKELNPQSKKLWMPRKRKIFKDKNEIPNEDELVDSYETGGFKYLNVAKKLNFLFENKKCQNVLENYYKEELRFTENKRQITIWSYTYRTCKFEFFFTGNIDYAYHLRVRLNSKEPWYDLDVPRILDGCCPVGTAHINQKFDSLIDELGLSKGGKGSKKKKKKKNDEKSINIKRLNIRFPIERIVGKDKTIKKLKERLDKIAVAKSSFNEEQEKMYAIWSALLEKI